MNSAIIPDSGDVRYIIENYHTLAMLCSLWQVSENRSRQHIERGLLPRATYKLADGLEYFPHDYFVFPSMAKASSRRDIFINRLRIAYAGHGFTLTFDEAEQTWNDYLSGSYGACLFIVLPETIARKMALIAAIERLTADPNQQDDVWRRKLTAEVDRLDALLRPFTNLDRALAGRPVSRDHYVTNVRARFLSASPIRRGI